MASAGECAPSFTNLNTVNPPSVIRIPPPRSELPPDRRTAAGSTRTRTRREQAARRWSSAARCPRRSRTTRSPPPAPTGGPPSARGGWRHLYNTLQPTIRSGSHRRRPVPLPPWWRAPRRHPEADLDPLRDRERQQAVQTDAREEDDRAANAPSHAKLGRSRDAVSAATTSVERSHGRMGTPGSAVRTIRRTAGTGRVAGSVASESTSSFGR